MGFYSSTAAKTIKFCIHRIRCIQCWVKVTSNKASKALSDIESWLPKGNIHYLLHISLGSNSAIGADCTWAVGVWQEWAMGGSQLWALWHTWWHTGSRFFSLCPQEILGWHIWHCPLTSAPLHCWRMFSAWHKKCFALSCPVTSQRVIPVQRVCQMLQGPARYKLCSRGRENRSETSPEVPEFLGLP